MFQIFSFENEINTWNEWIRCNKGTAVQNKLFDVHRIWNFCGTKSKKGLKIKSWQNKSDQHMRPGNISIKIIISNNL
jgi:hypothetical protein